MLAGKLMRLWTWAIDFREDGRFLTGEAELIAEKMRWKKSAKKLIDALCEIAPGEQAGFLIKTDSGYQIYNWDKYAGKLTDRRRKDRERKSKSIPQNFSDNSAGIPPESNGNESGLIKEEKRNSMCYRNPNRNRIYPSDNNKLAAYTGEGKNQETPPAGNPVFGDVLKAYESNLQTFPSPVIQQSIKDFITWGMSADVLTAAIRETTLAEGVNSRPKYFIAILDAWKGEGIRSKEQYDAYKARGKPQEGVKTVEHTTDEHGEKRDSAGHVVL
jgi:DnaD/phage-associated family protein